MSGPASDASVTAGSSLSPQVRDGPKADLACLVCRSRKVRCDKSLPTCHNCSRLGVPCPGYSAETEAISRKEIQKSADNIFKAAGVEKRRVGSCIACRSSKHRCSRTRPACRRCISRGVECVYPTKGGQEPDPSAAGPSFAAPGVRSHKTSPKISPAVSSEAAADLDVLCSDSLPEGPEMRLRLINAYFDRSHHVRCLSFLHKPTFLQSIERDSLEQDYGEPLLYIMCALGARHLYFSYAAASGCAMKTIPGSAWAEKARRDVLAEIDTPTIQHVMTLVLICDYEIRNDQNASAFVLISFLHRIIRLLSLDNPGDLEGTAEFGALLQRECENRLVWASYFIDMFVGTGVEKNTCWKSDVPDIPLPAPDHSFLAQMYSPALFVRQVEEAGVVPFIHDLDISALTILVTRLRFKSLRLIRKLPAEVGNLYNTSSPFLQILQQIDAIYPNIPKKYQLTEENLKSLRDHNLLGAVFFLHLLIHAVTFDLTRISLAGFNFPLAAAFQNVPAEFRLHCQEKCRFHADRVSELLCMGMAQGRETLDDTYCADAALECSKIEIIYAATVNRSPSIVEATRQNLGINLRFLEIFHIGKEGPSPYIRTLIPLCILFGFGGVTEKYRESFSPIEDPAEVTGSKEVEHLATFAPFRRARCHVRSRRSPNSLSSGYTQPSSMTHSTSQQPSSVMAASPRRPSETVLPTLRPDYPLAPPPAPPAPMVPTMPQAQRGQPLPTVNELAAAPGPAALQMTVDEYLKAAEEMSSYMTWDMSDLPPWLNFNNLSTP